jgi:two-component system sensor histidine kinase SenX3
MRSVVTRFGIWLLVLVAAVAAAIALPGPWGWLLAVVAVGGATAWLALDVSRRYARPIEELTTEHRRTVDRLAAVGAQSRRRETALANTSDAVVVIDPSGLVEYVNPTAQMFLQDRVLDVARKLQQPELDRLVQQARLTGEALAADVTLRIPGPKPARARAVPLADGSVVLLLSDLSESYRLDRVRRDFVANVSHELKTPVAAIRALAETSATALNSDDLEVAKRFVERLGTEAARLSDLVSDLLDLSRVESGGELKLADVDLGSLLAEAADRERAVAEAKGIELKVHPVQRVVIGDPSQLSMAVKNLVDNAVRYSEGGTIEISVAPRGEWIAITVADQGIGIPSDEIPRVFERFYRIDKARSRATGGTGLGLAIVRHVAENHGGRIEVESELGVGSTFALLLPEFVPSDNEGSAA